MNLQVLLNDDTGVAIIYRGLISNTKQIFDLLMQSRWRREKITMVGKTHMAKRLLCTYGDPGVTYTFSGKTESCEGWDTNKGIQLLREQVEPITQVRYNYVIANLYEDHNSKLGYHSDNEKDMDQRYTICSISLGATREFRIQPITKRFKAIGLPRPNLIKVDLKDGDMLIMAGNLQKFWKHSIPESKQSCGARINTTFRVLKLK